ncbi:hypothetical protein [Sporomusa carbonis]
MLIMLSTAFDKAGKGTADSRSMTEAILWGDRDGHNQDKLTKEASL